MILDFRTDFLTILTTRGDEGNWVTMKGSMSKTNRSCLVYSFNDRQLLLQLHVCECTVGVDVGDGTTIFLMSIFSYIVMGCIVLGRQMNVYFTTIVCPNTPTFVGMDVRFCTMKIHDSLKTCPQTITFIVTHRTDVQPYFCICIRTSHPNITILHKFTLCCCDSAATLALLAKAKSKQQFVVGLE